MRAKAKGWKEKGTFDAGAAGRGRINAKLAAKVLNGLRCEPDCTSR